MVVVVVMGIHCSCIRNTCVAFVAQLCLYWPLLLIPSCSSFLWNSSKSCKAAPKDKTCSFFRIRQLPLQPSFTVTAAFQISLSRHVYLTNLGAVHIPDLLQYYIGVCLFLDFFSNLIGGGQARKLHLWISNLLPCT